MSGIFQVMDPVSGVVWMLLGLLALMFTATALAAFFLWRRANAPIPPHILFIETLNSEPEEC